MMKQISAKIDESDADWKRKSGLPYRYLIAKGRAHMETCVPRSQMIEENFQKALNFKNVERLKYYIQQKHPQIWTAFLEEVEWKR